MTADELDINARAYASWNRHWWDPEGERAKRQFIRKWGPVEYRYADPSKPETRRQAARREDYNRRVWLHSRGAYPAPREPSIYEAAQTIGGVIGAAGLGLAVLLPCLAAGPIGWLAGFLIVPLAAIVGLYVGALAVPVLLAGGALLLLVAVARAVFG
jgi:hypothetical protein